MSEINKIKTTMVKKFLGVAVFALSIFSINASAASTQTVQDNKTCSAQTCSDNKSKDCVAAKEVCCNLYEFEGINLTDAQKTQLKSLKQKQASERKAERVASKEDKKKAREERRAQSKESKRKYLEEVKAIIGPDQYVVFLENIVVNGNRGGNKVKAAQPYCKMPRNNVKGAKKGSDSKCKDRKNCDNRKKCDDQKKCTAGSPSK